MKYELRWAYETIKWGVGTVTWDWNEPVYATDSRDVLDEVLDGSLLDGSVNAPELVVFEDGVASPTLASPGYRGMRLPATPEGVTVRSLDAFLREYEAE